MRSFCFLSSVITFIFIITTAVTSDSEFRIHNAEELTNLSEYVNKETSFLSVTVFLDSDIDFTEELSKKFEPISGSNNDVFFDGQGHTISNLAINSSKEYVGLFGCLSGLAIRNVVLDDSCSVVCSYSDSSYAYVGGIAGFLNSFDDSFIVENCVNMASVAFTGSTGDDNLHLGGIVGYFFSDVFDSYVKNCVNYGVIMQSGKGMRAYIGGIIGGSCGSGQYLMVYVYNCINYGTIMFNETTTVDSSIGGITGYNYLSVIENCVSAGGIVVSNKPSDTHIGTIAGYALSTDVTNCFWTSDADYDRINGTGYIVVDAATSKASPDSALISKLNSYSSANSWNSWLLNSNNVTVSFKVNDYKVCTVKSQIILLPYIVDNKERSFTGWYNDADLTSLFTASEAKAATALYGMFCGSNYTVTLDANGGNELDVNEMVIKCNGTYGNLPSLTKVGYTFVGWFTERTGGNRIESGDRVTNMNNHTLYEQWTINNYTLRFVFNNSVNEDKVEIVDYNTLIPYPDNPEREGYTFYDWDNDTQFMPADNLTITALWTPRKYIITFDVNGGEELQDATKEVIFDSVYGELPTPTMAGHAFVGWFTEKNESVTNETRVSVPSNHALHARWEEVTQQVEVVFETKDMTKDEIEEVIKQYTSAKFTIVETVDDESGETKVVIKFIDNGEAEEFVRNIRESTGKSDVKIKRVNFNSDGLKNVSPAYPCHLSLYFSILFSIFLVRLL